MSSHEGVSDRSTKNLNLLVADLEGDNIEKSVEAAKKLREMGKMAVPYLIRELGVSSESVRSLSGGVTRFKIQYQVQESLIGIGEPVIEPLISALDDEYVGCEAPYILTEIGEPAIKPLIRALRSDNERILCYSAMTLVRIDDVRAREAIRQAIEPLISVLANDENAFLAEDVLVKIGEPAVEALIAVLKHDDEDTLFHAARALKRIGDARAIGPLIRLHENTVSSRVRGQTGLGLGRFGDPHAIPSLVHELHYQNWIQEVQEGLAKIGSAAVEPIISSLEEEGKGTAYTSAIANHIRVLGMIGDARAAEALKAQTAPDKEDRLRTIALEALAKLDVQYEISAEEIERLRISLLSNDYEVRKNALKQAQLVSGSVDDSAFRGAFQACERLQMAFDHQREAVSSQEPMHACQDAIRLEPGFSAAYVCLSYLLREYTENFNEALKWARKAVKSDPDNMYAWTELGMVQVSLRDVVAATCAFQTVVTAEPEHANLEPYARLVAVYRRLNMQDLLEKARLRLANAGVGLDRDRERDWERMVREANRGQLRKAIVSRAPHGIKAKRKAKCAQPAMLRGSLLTRFKHWLGRGT